MPPKVTVLIPAYNGVSDLPSAIDSVLAQTFSDFELLVMDDGSTDGTPELVEAHPDPRIRLVRLATNVGQVAALNRGLEVARGEYVARLDQDDRCLPRRLERQVAALDADSTLGVVGSWMEIVDADGKPMRSVRRHLDGFADFVFAALADRLPLAHSAVCFRKVDVLALGGYDETIPYAEDTDLWRRLALARRGAHVVPESLLVYRAHPGQQSWARRDDQRAGNLRSHDRFVAALSASTPPDAVRLLLSRDERVWDEHGSEEGIRELSAELELLLERSAERLRLGREESHRLGALLRAEVGATARRSWRRGPRQILRAAPLQRFGSRDATPTVATGRMLAYGALAVAAPLLHLLVSIKRRALAAR